MAEKGTISVSTDDLFPIIKKWLYSEHDIFLRELLSNAVDAITKHHHLIITGESNHKDIKHNITVTTDSEKKTITIKDTGLGMTAEEVKKYINQIALSSAEDFVKKFKDAGQDAQVIGHFGLGFYSSFMVSTKVEIRTLSFQEGAEAVYWECDGSTSFSMDSCDKTDVGTEITLYLDKDSENFADEYSTRQTMERYWQYCPFDLKLNDNQINTEKAIWAENPSQVKEKQYKEFYTKMFPTGEEPLFWIHLNFDLPLNLRGILYFPKLTNDPNGNKGRIKLFSNQVFVTDETQDIVPPFLEMLRGVIDWPDMPLNVSRSSLQGNPKLKKIAARITKKIADKLNGLRKNNFDDYVGFWKDINPVVKIGAIQDREFYDRVKDSIIFKSANSGEWTNLSDYLERAKENHENKIYYASDEHAQASYIEMFKKQNKEVLILNSSIDPHLIQFLEYGGGGMKFQRIDSNLEDATTNADKEDSKEEQKENKQIIKLFKKSIGDKKVKIEVKELGSADIPAVVILPEHQRRLHEMQAMNLTERTFVDEYDLIINSASPLAAKLTSLDAAKKTTEVDLICKHVHDLALIGQNNFDPTKMGEFINRSNKIISILAS